MSDARELLAMRTKIHAGLDPRDIPRINFAALANAVADALARGWTGDELAGIALESLYTGEVRDIGAVMLSNLRGIRGQDPIREITPTARPFAELRVELDQAASVARTVDHRAWADKVRGKASA